MKRTRVQVVAGAIPAGISVGSDKKIPGGVNGACVLCQQTSNLQLSHIVPKWMYKWAKEESLKSDRRGLVGVYKSIGVTVRQQDGTKHYLLCGACEQRLGLGEKYAASLMLNAKFHFTSKGRMQGTSLPNVDAQLIQRYLLGVLFKAHFAPSVPYHRVSLPAETLEKIRQALHTSAFDDHHFPIVALRFESKYIKGADERAMVYPNYFPNPEDCPMFELFAAGWSWMVFLNENGKCPKEFYDLRLRESEPFFVPAGDIVSHRFINGGRFLNRRERRALKR